MIMKFFRKKRNMKIILWAVAILIIPSFIILGLGGKTGGKRESYAAMVNKEYITLREYYTELSKTEANYRKMFGENASEFLKKLNIEEGVLENMIRDRILVHEAKQRRIRVLNNEIVEIVKTDPVFLDENGRFDERRYREIISSIPAEELRKTEDAIRHQIMLEKLKETVLAEVNTSISNEELDTYIKDNQIQDTDREALETRLLWRKREEHFEQWYADKRKDAKVEIYLLFQPPAIPTE